MTYEVVNAIRAPYLFRSTSAILLGGIYIFVTIFINFSLNTYDTSSYHIAGHLRHAVVSRHQEGLCWQMDVFSLNSTDL